MPAKPANDNEAQFHPVQGQEYYNLESKKDIHITAGNDETIDITHDRTINVDGKHTETIKGDTDITISEGDVNIYIKKGDLVHSVSNATASYYVKEEVQEIYDDKQTTTVANEIEIASKTSHIILTGCTSIHLHVGDSQICMGSDGTIKISGKHVQIIGSDKVEIKGKEIVSAAEAQHEISGANVKSAATGNNIVKGAAVMLNPPD